MHSLGLLVGSPLECFPNKGKYLPNVDLRRPNVQHDLMRAIALKYVGYVHFGITCARWGRGGRLNGCSRTLDLPEVQLRPFADLQLAALDAALDALEESAPAVKRQVLQAAVACVAADRTVTASEAELLRAISASLGCPMPPLLLD